MVQAIQAYSSPRGYEKKEDNTLRNVLIGTAITAAGLFFAYKGGQTNLKKLGDLGVDSAKWKNVGLFDGAESAAKSLGKNADDVKDLNILGRFTNMVDSWFDWGKYAKDSNTMKKVVESASESKKATPAPKKSSATSSTSTTTAVKSSADETTDFFEENYTRVKTQADKYNEEYTKLTEEQKRLQAIADSKTGEKLSDADKARLNTLNEQLEENSTYNAQRISAQLELEKIELVKERAKLSKLQEDLGKITDKKSDEYKTAQQARDKAKNNYQKKYQAYTQKKQNVGQYANGTGKLYSETRHKNFAIMEENIARKLDVGQQLTPAEIEWINYNQSSNSLYKGKFYDHATGIWGEAKANVKWGKKAYTKSAKGKNLQNKGYGFTFKETEVTTWQRPDVSASNHKFGTLLLPKKVIPSKVTQTEIANFNTAYANSGYSVRIGDNGKIIANGGAYAQDTEITSNQFKALEAQVRKSTGNIILPSYQNPFLAA